MPFVEGGRWPRLGRILLPAFPVKRAVKPAMRHQFRSTRPRISCTKRRDCIRAPDTDARERLDFDAVRLRPVSRSHRLHALAPPLEQRPVSLSPQFLDELRARTSLSGVVGRTVK